MLDEWGGDDVQRAVKLLETQFGEVGIDLKTHPKNEDDEEEEEEDDDDDDEDDDEDEDG